MLVLAQPRRNAAVLCCCASSAIDDPGAAQAQCCVSILVPLRSPINRKASHAVVASPEVDGQTKNASTYKLMRIVAQTSRLSLAIEDKGCD